MDTSSERLSELTARLHDTQAFTDRVRWLALEARLGTSDEATVLGYFEGQHRRAPFTLQSKALVPPLTTTDGGTALLLSTTDPIIVGIQKQVLPTRLTLPTVPFGVPTPVQSTLGAYAWVLQNTPKPVTRIDWTSVTNPIGKIAGIVPLSRELVKFSPGADAAIGRALTAGAVRFSDRQFLDPAVTLVANQRPASITNGVTPITATGTTIAAKVSELVAALFATRPQTSRPALIATPAVAAALAGADPGLAASGSYSGIPLFQSPEAGALVIALDRDGVVYSEDVDGGSVTMSQEATIELNDAAAPPDAATVVTSFWQTNLVGYRVERWCWWQKVDATVVQVVAA
jgi:hypothetical protein